MARGKVLELLVPVGEKPLGLWPLKGLRVAFAVADRPGEPWRFLSEGDPRKVSRWLEAGKL